MEAKTPFRILLATGNAGKIAELRALFSELPVNLIAFSDLEGIVDVAETGSTFAENAALKASGYAVQTGLFSFADDSGLEVSALDGEPGVFSARYGGEGSTFAQKMEIILSRLAAIPNADRAARFVCSMSLADANGNILFTAAGTCPGKIAEAPRGKGGFGYDPIFIPDGFELTFGELEADMKQQISHRARAAAKIMRYLRDFIAV